MADLISILIHYSEMSSLVKLTKQRNNRWSRNSPMEATYLRLDLVNRFPVVRHCVQNIPCDQINMWHTRFLVQRFPTPPRPAFPCRDGPYDDSVLGDDASWHQLSSTLIAVDSQYSRDSSNRGEISELSRATTCGTISRSCRECHPSMWMPFAAAETTQPSR